MPEENRGVDKFGSEHAIKPGGEGKQLSAREVRDKAKHYQDKTDY